MATRNLSIRLSVKDAEIVRRALEGLGEDGQRALKRLDSASREASRGTLVLNDAMGEVRGTAQGYAAQLGPLGAGLTALGPAGLAAAAGIGAAVLGLGAAMREAKEAVTAFGDLADTANRIGVSTDALQEWRHVAVLSGVDIGTLETSLERFVRRLGQARQGTGAMVSGLKESHAALLAQVQAAGSTDEALALVIEAMAEIPDAADRAVVAEAAFGRAGIDMGLIAAGGAEKIGKLRQEAHDLGLVVDREVIRAAEDMGDKFDIASKVIDTQLKVAFVELAPLIVNVANALASGARWATEFIERFRDIDDLGVDAIKRRLADVRAEIAENNKLIDRLAPDSGYVRPAHADEQRAQVMKENRALHARAVEYESELARRQGEASLKIDINKPAPVDTGTGQPAPTPNPGASDAAKRAADEEARANDKVAESVMRLLEARRTLDQGVKDMISTMQRERAELTMSDQERYVSEQVLRAEALARQQGVEITNAQREAVRAEAEETFKATEAHRQLTEMRTRGRALHERLMTPQERQADAAAELAELYGQGAIGEEDFRRGLADLREQTVETTSAADDLGLTFSSAFEDAIVGGKEFSEVLKGLQQDLLRIATRKLITEPLANAATGMFNDLLGGGAPQQSMAWRNPDTGQVLDTGGGGGGGLLSGIFASIFHSGGVVGGPAPMRAVPMETFRDAPRLHGGGGIGLRGDEVPAILQRGEVVLPRGGAMMMPNIVINNNAPAATVDVQPTNGGRSLEIVIDEVVAGAIKSGGRTQQALRQMGIKPATVVR